MATVVRGGLKALLETISESTFTAPTDEPRGIQTRVQVYLGGSMGWSRPCPFAALVESAIEFHETAPVSCSGSSEDCPVLYIYSLSS